MIIYFERGILTHLLCCQKKGELKKHTKPPDLGKEYIYWTKWSVKRSLEHNKMIEDWRSGGRKKIQQANKNKGKEETSNIPRIVRALGLVVLNPAHPHTQSEETSFNRWESSYRVDLLLKRSSMSSKRNFSASQIENITVNKRRPKSSFIKKKFFLGF